MGWSGDVVVNTSGTLTIGSDAALGGTLTINGGNIQAHDATRTINVTNAITVNGDFAIVGDDIMDLSGTINVGGNLSLNVASTTVVLDHSPFEVSNITGAVTIAGLADLTNSGTDSTEVIIVGDVTVVDGGEVVVSLATVNGSYEQDSGGTLQIVLVDSVLDGDRPAIAITGSAMLDGTLQITAPQGLTVPMDSRFDILSADSLVGGFATLIDQTGSGLRLGQDGNTLYLTNFPIPEPTTLALMSLLGITLALRRRQQV